MPESLSAEQMVELDEAHHFMETGNSEILFAWLMLVIQNEYEPGYETLEAFLKRVGRRKFLAPLYQAMAQTTSGKQSATEIYKDARSGYHPVSYGTIDQILGYTP